MFGISSECCENENTSMKIKSNGKSSYKIFEKSDSCYGKIKPFLKMLKVGYSEKNFKPKNLYGNTTSV